MSAMGLAALEAEVERACKACGERFTGTRRMRFCSEACRWFNCNTGAACDVVWSTCDLCGTRVARRAAVQYCSRACRERRPRKWRKHADLVHRRDGMICQLCGVGMSATWATGDPLSPTLDHVIPRSLGGADDPSNLRSAHWACNVMRGDRAGVHEIGLSDALAYVGLSLDA